MRISIITITCRQHPRFAKMAATIAANAAANPDVDLEWVVVDELLDDAASERANAFGMFESLNIGHIACPPSTHREQGLPDRASAWNHGIAHASGDYLVFVGDCTMLVAGWLKAVAKSAADGTGFTCKTKRVKNMEVNSHGEIPSSGPFRAYRALPASVKSCIGAPATAIADVRGFDEAYSGQKGWEMLDLTLRLSRRGVSFWGDHGAYLIELQNTHRSDEVSKDGPALKGQRNATLFSDLRRDQKRILPKETSIADATPLSPSNTDGALQSVPAATSPQGEEETHPGTPSSKLASGAGDDSPPAPAPVKKKKTKKTTLKAVAKKPPKKKAKKATTKKKSVKGAKKSPKKK